ncbi:MAG: hypothetical protein HYX20_00085 [Candidatus Yanofskybacteria bacterium]|nr:hypothetical protein [Candidatus Yanofskybacteria bacterium]
MPIKKLIKNIFKKEDAKSPGFKILPDRPLGPDEDEDIRFGHKDVAKTVFSLIDNAESPITLGLYGRWGVGKTTIASLVRDMASKNKMMCLFFDSWKYERDSLRRQFLIELDKQIFNKKFNYAKKLNQSLSRPEELTFGQFLKQIFKHVAGRAIGILTIIIVAMALVWVVTDKPVPTLITLLYNLGILGTFISFILSGFEILKGSVQIHRTDSAEGFESHFKEALSDPKLKDKVLLIIIDNLDRVEDEKAVGILSDIKTFLSDDGFIKNRVKFLIPCDDQALRAQLRAKYGESFDTDEFLRKFFNLTIKIPKFIDLDLYVYVQDLLKESLVPEFQNNRDLEDVIILALRDNPREIKQFINSLTSQVVLSKERKLEAILKNTAFLAKLLIIRQKFPVLYEIIEEKSLRARISLDTNEIIELYKKELELKDYEDKKGKIIEREIESFKKFNELSPVNEENIDVFVTLRQSKEEKSIPEWSSLVLALEEGDEGEATEIVKSIKKDEKLDQLDLLLKSRVEKLKSGPIITRLVSSTMIMLCNIKEKLPKFFDTAANYFPFGQDFMKVYDQFDLDTVFDFWYENTSTSKKFKIIGPVISLLASRENDGSPVIEDEYSLKLFEIINKKPQAFKSEETNLKNHIESVFFKHPHLTKLNSKDARQLFITEKAASKYIDSLEKSQIENIEELKIILNLWVAMDLPDGSIFNSIKKLGELMTAYDNSTKEEKIIICDGVARFTKKYVAKLDPNVSPDQNQFLTEVSQLSLNLAKYYDDLPESRTSVINLIDFYSLIEGNPRKDALDNRIKDFILNTGETDMGVIKKQTLKEWSSNYSDSIINRGQKDIKFVLDKEIYKYLTPEQNQTLVVGLMSNGQNPKPVLDAISFNVHSQEALIKDMIPLVSKVNPTDLADIFKSLIELGVDKMTDQIENFKLSIIELKKLHPDKSDDIEKVVKAKKHQKLFNPGQQAELLGEESE